MNYFYDFHIHSCLSPCADDDNTPNNIAGMASLCGLNIIALTDHNSCRNCPAFFEAAKRYSITPVAGMELTTSEDIHVIC
ncbi:MAG: PHP domain-containing protein, partial [Clostridia bacterium]|nr:PHP domain-containing protein [Clostridia bacterium]